jgi:SanA protein
MFFAKFCLVSLIIFSAVFLLPRLVTAIYARNRIFAGTAIPQDRQVAIVFGAGLWRDGRPTPVLRDRVATAAELYFAGKISKLLMSGDNSQANYNEPAAMRSYALELGVRDEDIVLDYAGRRTYDTCYRAGHIFGIKEAVLVTQSFHLPRAIFTCNRLGVKAIGVASDLRQYRPNTWFYWNLRELPATLVAVWQVYVSHPLPILGEPQPIFPVEAQ